MCAGLSRAHTDVHIHAVAWSYALSVKGVEWWAWSHHLFPLQFVNTPPPWCQSWATIMDTFGFTHEIVWVYEASCFSSVHSRTTDINVLFRLYGFSEKYTMQKSETKILGFWIPKSRSPCYPMVKKLWNYEVSFRKKVTCLISLLIENRWIRGSLHPTQTHTHTHANTVHTHSLTRSLITHCPGRFRVSRPHMLQFGAASRRVTIWKGTESPSWQSYHRQTCHGRNIPAQSVNGRSKMLWTSVECLPHQEYIGHRNVRLTIIYINWRLAESNWVGSSWCILIVCGLNTNKLLESIKIPLVFFLEVKCAHTVEYKVICQLFVGSLDFLLLRQWAASITTPSPRWLLVWLNKASLRDNHKTSPGDSSFSVHTGPYPSCGVCSCRWTHWAVSAALALREHAHITFLPENFDIELNRVMIWLSWRFLQHGWCSKLEWRSGLLQVCRRETVTSR